METKELKQASKKIMWLFAVGQLGWSMLSGVVTSWLVYFYQPSDDVVSKGQTLFLPQGAVFIGLTIIGLIAAIGRIFDAVTDPWIAGKSDRCRSRLGRRIPFMRAAAVPLGIVTVLVFLLAGQFHKSGQRHLPARHGSALLPVHDDLLHAFQCAYSGAWPYAGSTHQCFYLYFLHLHHRNGNCLPSSEHRRCF